MNDRKIQVFLYGSSINLDVLSKAGLKKRAFAPAMLLGFELTIQPVANLVENGDGVVFGILANFTHSEIETLVASHTPSLTDAPYQVEPVIVRTRGGRTVPALTYLSADMAPGMADKAYISRILKPAKNYGFPSWYIERIKAFLPTKDEA